MVEKQQQNNKRWMNVCSFVLAIFGILSSCFPWFRICIQVPTLGLGSWETKFVEKELQTYNLFELWDTFGGITGLLDSGRDAKWSLIQILCILCMFSVICYFVYVCVGFLRKKQNEFALPGSAIMAASAGFILLMLIILHKDMGSIGETEESVKAGVGMLLSIGIAAVLLVLECNRVKFEEKN